MKVLFISSWYPNSTNALKGIYIKKHAAAVRSAGIEVEVLALTVSYSKKLIEKKEYVQTDENGIQTHMIELNSKFYKLLYVNLILQSGILNKYYRKNIKNVFKPDVIHSHVLFPAAILGYWLSLKEKLPHVITEHWSKVDNFMSKNLYAKSGRKAYNGAKKVTAVSNFLKESISKHFDDKSNIEVVPNVVNTDLFIYKEKPGNFTEIIFTIVAHWADPKRPDLIFHSLQKASKEINKNIILNVVGEGHLLKELKNESWSFKINYLGNLAAKDLSALLQNSNYFLHASNIETFSIVIAEALSTGTPVLASKVGAIPELINDQNGFVCDNTTDDWEEGLMRLINKTDFNGKLISDQASKFNYENIGAKFKTIYQS